MESKPINQNAPPPVYYPPPQQHQPYSQQQQQQQQGSLPGQTYYQPPPQQYNQPPPPPSQPSNLRERVNRFYNPQNPQNPNLGKKRKFASGFCCFIILALIISLAAGIATRNRHHYAYCRVNNDCFYRYGSGVYCYNGYCSR
ncbi:unnamed protein product [Cunninghamella blakesleeana]